MKLLLPLSMCLVIAASFVEAQGPIDQKTAEDILLSSGISKDMIEKIKGSLGRGVHNEAEAKQKLIGLGIPPDVIDKIEATAAAKLGKSAGK